MHYLLLGRRKYLNHGFTWNQKTQNLRTRRLKKERHVVIEPSTSLPTDDLQKTLSTTTDDAVTNGCATGDTNVK